MAKKTCACLVVVLMLIFAGMICAELSQAAAWQTSITATGQTVGSAVKVSTVIIGEAETAVTHPAPPTPVEYTTYTYLTDLGRLPSITMIYVWLAVRLPLYGLLLWILTGMWVTRRRRRPQRSVGTRLPLVRGHTKSDLVRRRPVR